MVDQTPAPVIPSLWTQIVQAIAQKGLTAAATALTGYGVIAPTQQQQFVSLGLAVVSWGVSFAWTYFHEKHNHATMTVALNTSAPHA